MQEKPHIWVYIYGNMLRNTYSNYKVVFEKLLDIDSDILVMVLSN